MPLRDYGVFFDLSGRPYRVRDDPSNPSALTVCWDGGGACDVVAFRCSKMEASRLRRLLGEATGETEGEN